ncbi:MAG TPA: MqnA/MqnD/SBP family protein, partial [Saprospiraceae bacterium]|nr:MqnA/MqnD/SBP family protein [Saprospiraceae bacterium]
ECARLFKQNEVDISLCPVGALDEMGEFEIVGDYCIGADGPVNTVMLMSNIPLEEIETVRLDSHSRTSNLLVQILAKQHWKKEWSYYDKENGMFPDANVMIGDKVFKEKDNFQYHYDLAAAWKELTGLPMLFAVWIAKPGIPGEPVHQINESFEAGMEFVKNGNNLLAPWQVVYLTNSISYPLDDQKRKALTLFNSWKEQLHSSIVLNA